MLLTQTVEYLGGHSTRRGYHTAEYAIAAETWEEARMIADAHLLLPNGSVFVAREPMSDGRWRCRAEWDTGD